MERRLALSVVVLAAVGALALSAAVVTPVGAQTATPTPTAPAENGTNGTVIEASFAGSPADSERRRAAEVVEARLAGSPGYNGTVRTTDDGVLIEVRPAAPPAVVDLLVQGGNVTVTASTPEGSGAVLFDNSDVRRAGSLQAGSGAVVVPVYLTPDGAANMSATLVRLNHTANPERCEEGTRSGYCLVVRLDGSVVNTAGITPRFAEVVAAGNFTGSRGFAVATERVNPAVRLQVALAAGRLPAEVTATSVRNVTTFDQPAATPGADPSTTQPGVSPTATPANDSSGGTSATGGGSPGFTPAVLVLAALVLAGFGAQTLRT